MIKGSSACISSSSKGSEEKLGQLLNISIAVAMDAKRKQKINPRKKMGFLEKKKKKKG